MVMTSTLITHLHTLLNTHIPWDASERDALTRMRAFLATPITPEPLNILPNAAPWVDRQNTDPGHFTASALVLSPCMGNIALIMHRKLNRWLQPGGHIEAEDGNVITAAQREVHEECGLDTTTVPHGPVLHHLDVHTIPATATVPAHTHFDLRMLLQARTTTLIAASDANAAQWFALETLHTVDTDASVHRAVQKWLQNHIPSNARIPTRH